MKEAEEIHNKERQRSTGRSGSGKRTLRSQSAGQGGAGTCVTGLVKLSFIEVGESQNDHHSLSLSL